MSNKSKGSKFEEDLAEWLSNKGYWCHLVEGAGHTGSQPCDIFVVKDNVPVLIDGKTLEGKTGRFPIHRIEENQRLCYRRWKKCGNNDYYLAIIWENDVYFVNMDDVNFRDKSIDLKCLKPKIKEFYDANQY